MSDVTKTSVHAEMEINTILKETFRQITHQIFGKIYF